MASVSIPLWHLGPNCSPTPDPTNNLPSSKEKKVDIQNKANKIDYNLIFLLVKNEKKYLKSLNHQQL